MALTALLRRNIIFNGLGQATVLLVSFIGVRYLFRGMGGDAFGILVFAQAFNIVLLSALDGFSVTTVREVAAQWRKQDHELLPFLRTLSLIYGGGFVLGASAVALSSQWFVEHWFNRHTIDVGSAAMLLRIFAVGASTAVLRNYLGGILRGVQRMEFGNATDIATTACQQLGAVFVISHGGGSYGVAYLFTACFGISTLAYGVAAARFVGWQALLPSWNLGSMAGHIRSTSHNVAVSILRTAYLQGDKAVVSKISALTLFGYYSLASTVAMRLSFIAVAVSQAGLPVLAQLHRAGNVERFARLHADLEELQFTLGAPVAAAFIFASIPLFSYLLNPSAGTALAVPAVLLAIGLFLYISTTIATTSAQAAARADIVMRGSLLSVLVGLPLEVFLVAKFSLTGAGVAWVVANVVLVAATVPFVYRACFDTIPRPWLAQLLRVIGLCSVSYAPGWLIASRFGASVAVVLAAFVAATALYGVLAVVSSSKSLRSWLLTPQDRADHSPAVPMEPSSEFVQSDG